ncbi:MAG TPA: hypothetical protein PLJ21_13950, partial [Pseudobdellovibrionaceae bacterium]|nr:hypothetical protein [Pseudobdellovibrionaceae bacterium]
MKPHNLKLKILGFSSLTVLLILYQQCSNIKLVQPVVEPGSNHISGKLCFPYDSETYSEYSLSEFYIINLTARKYKNSNQPDSNMNGVLDSLETSDSLQAQSTIHVNELDLDKDGLPDFIENLKGLNPTRNDLEEDGFDLDGVTNKRELQRGTDPDFTSEDSEVNYSLQEDLEASSCGVGQPSYSFEVKKIPVVNTSAFVDKINSNALTSLTHDEDENVFLILARMTPSNALNDIKYLAKFFKHSSLMPISKSLSNKDFFILGSEASNSEDGNSSPLKYYQKVATGDKHSCAITTTGRVYCWGNNSYGQLGDVSFLPRFKPTPTQLDADVKSISIGAAHTCA